MVTGPTGFYYRSSVINLCSLAVSISIGKIHTNEKHHELPRKSTSQYTDDRINSILIEKVYKFKNIGQIDG
jgi:hypothetical protein